MQARSFGDLLLSKSWGRLAAPARSISPRRGRSHRAAARVSCYAVGVTRAHRTTHTGSAGMTNKGFSHLGLSTLDLDRTRDFYENVLGFKPVRCDIIKVKEGGQIRNSFLNTGGDRLIASLKAAAVRGWRATY